MYRKAFVELAAQRGWTLDDAPAGEATAHATVSVPGVDAGIDASGDAAVDGGPGTGGGCCCAIAGARGALDKPIAVLVALLAALRRRRVA